MAVKFKRDVKRCQKRGLPMDELWTVVRTLLRGEPLHPKYKAHILTGDHKGEWETQGLVSVSLSQEENMTVAGTAKLLLFTNEQGKTNNNCC